MKYARPSWQAGFTLLEVLVAFTILSLTLGVLLQLFGTGLRNAGISEDYTRAVLQAESLLAAVGVEEPLEPGVRGGELAPPFAWQSTVTPFIEEGLDMERLEAVGITPYLVTVEVSWTRGERTRSVVLDTLRLTRELP